MRYTQVSDSLAAHKTDLKQFWRRVRATKGKFWLLVVAGESECVPSDPTATSPVVVKGLCDAGHFNPELYRARNVNQLTRAVHSPLVGATATLLRENHSEGDNDEFFGIETFWDICGMTRLVIREDSALAAGRVADLYVIAAGDSGEPIFSKVFSCKRRGEHAVVETRPLETLFAVAVDESRSSIAVELRRRVGALHGDALAEVESRLRERDAFKCEVEEILEEARVSGKHPTTILVGYHPTIAIGGSQGLETDFVRRETELRSFPDFESLVRRAARNGIRLLDCRVISRGDGRRPSALNAIADLVPAADKCLVKRIAVFVPVWKSTSDLGDIRAEAPRVGRAARRTCRASMAWWHLSAGAWPYDDAHAGTTGPSPLPMKTTAAMRSRQWHRISTPSSRCSYEDEVASMVWGVRNLISTQVNAG